MRDAYRQTPPSTRRGGDYGELERALGAVGRDRIIDRLSIGLGGLGWQPTGDHADTDL
jgi:hypothetical protein